jgi:uncharacterized protein
MTVLVDSSVLVAYAFNRDSNHLKARELFQQVANEQKVIAQPVLTEIFYLLIARANYDRAVQMFQLVRTNFDIEPLTKEDFARMDEILTQYIDSKLDFTDVAIMTLSERLKITRVCTFDRRDFPIFRPAHCDALELLP